MELINYLNNNDLIWDNKYFDIELSKSDIRQNPGIFKNVLVKIMKGMDKEEIDTKFYYLGRIIARLMKPLVSVEDKKKLTTNLIFDMFLPFEEIENYDDFEDKTFGNRPIKSIWEYFILSRGLIKYDIQSCAPFMHKVNLYDTNILEYYGRVEDKLYRTNYTKQGF